jgi:hypothetical protein
MLSISYCFVIEICVLTDEIFRSMAQTVSCQPLTAGGQLQSLASHIGFVVDKVTFGQYFCQVLWFSPVSIIPLRLRTHSSITGTI